LPDARRTEQSFVAGWGGCSGDGMWRELVEEEEGRWHLEDGMDASSVHTM